MKRKLSLWTTCRLIGGVVAAALCGSWLTGQWFILAGAFPVLVVVLYFGLRRKRRQPEHVPAPRREPVKPKQQSRKPTPVERQAFNADDPAYLAQQMLEQGRYALLLRPQIAENLRSDQYRVAMRCLDEGMGLVPEGDVLLQSWRSLNDREEMDSKQDRLVHVEAIYLDRYPVTNEQYQKFVTDGGYENMSLWDATIWPAVLDFVDRTGHPGPRSWEEGAFPRELADHPVVGVSWYEAAAYARWAGKRLPSDPEWVKAGCWPVLTQGTRPMQRRYPWGDTMDRELAHLWGANSPGTVSVYDLPGGVSVGGIYHLIGNVWEWTSSNFGVWDTSIRKIETSTPMKSIRGGAFDTYFDTQAMCQFQSGENPIHRKHNIGFRCALAMCDVVSSGLDDEIAGRAEAVGCGVDAGEVTQ